MIKIWIKKDSNSPKPNCDLHNLFQIGLQWNMLLVTWSLLRGQLFIESPNITQSRPFKLKSVIFF